MPGPAAVLAAGWDRLFFTQSCTSSRKIRSRGPVPFTAARSTPNSRASLRTAGPACTGALVTPPWPPVLLGAAATLPCFSGTLLLAAFSSVLASTFSSLLSSLLSALLSAFSCSFFSADGAAACSSFCSDADSADSPVALTSSSNSGSPCLTRSPFLTNSFITVPAKGSGTSTVALSDSSTTMVSSSTSWSPTLTEISITSTASSLPISGTRTISMLMLFSSVQRWVGFVRIDAKLLHRRQHLLRLNLAFICQRLQRRQGNKVTIDLKEMTQLLP